jgi:hypothetical protein
VQRALPGIDDAGRLGGLRGGMHDAKADRQRYRKHAGAYQQHSAPKVQTAGWLLGHDA